MVWNEKNGTMISRDIYKSQIKLNQNYEFIQSSMCFLSMGACLIIRKRKELVDTL